MKYLDSIMKDGYSVARNVFNEDQIKAINEPLAGLSISKNIRSFKEIDGFQIE